MTTIAQSTPTLSAADGVTPTFRAALEALNSAPLNGLEKGLPPTALRLGDLGQQGWNVLNGDVPLPAMVIRWADVEHNIRLMQAYCNRHGAWLSPHGKTTMAPQLFGAQLAAGSWAITVANIAQLQVCRSFGLSRVLVANEMVADYDVRYLAAQMRNDPDFEPYVLVDSPEGLEYLCRGLWQSRVPRPLAVLVELGMEGGRCGVRQVGDVESLAEAVLAAVPVVRLAGVEGYEGIVPGPTHEDRMAAAERYLQTLAGVVRNLRQRVPADQPFLVTAGGSVYFDQVVSILGRAVLPEAQLVLRSGGYVTHDSGFYEKRSPLGGLSGRAAPAERLRPALEVWSVVLTCPAAGLAILGMGGRDMPTDLEMPLPLWHSRHGAAATPIGTGFEVFRSNDQHAYLRVPPGADLRVGDLVGCGISHPCTAFDKWRVLLVVDEHRNVIDAVRTFF